MAETSNKLERTEDVLDFNGARLILIESNYYP